MNQTFASSSIISDIAERFDNLTPEMKKAARFVIENPQEVGVSTVREIAEFAEVNPNTFVRMARQLGYEGYEDFRQPFKEAIRAGFQGFPDRARWLQNLQQSGHMGHLYVKMIKAAIHNLESTFSQIDTTQLHDAAIAIWNARNVYTLGVGVNNANARNFSYLASTGMVQFHAIPRAGSVATDDLAWADEKDILIAITHAPYRSEVLAAIEVAKEQGVKVIGISDSPVSPVIFVADHGFVTAVETPQFFPSSVATIALLETLLSFVIASASDEIVERVEKFHQRRHQLGLYLGDDK